MRISLPFFLLPLNSARVHVCFRRQRQRRIEKEEVPRTRRERRQWSGGLSKSVAVSGQLQKTLARTTKNQEEESGPYRRVQGMTDDRLLTVLPLSLSLSQSYDRAEGGTRGSCSSPLGIHSKPTSATHFAYSRCLLPSRVKRKVRCRHPSSPGT